MIRGTANVLHPVLLLKLGKLSSADTIWGPLSLTAICRKDSPQLHDDLGRCSGSHLYNLWPLGVGIYYHHKPGILWEPAKSTWIWSHGLQAKPREAAERLLVHSWQQDMPYSSWPLPQCLRLAQATKCGFWQVTSCEQPLGVLGVAPGYVSALWPALQPWYPSRCSLPPQSAHSCVVWRLAALLALPQQANLSAYTAAPDPGLGLDG